MTKPRITEHDYRQAIGDTAAERALNAQNGRCDYCWAPAGEPHASICPNRTDDQEPPPTSQEEALF